MQAIHLIEKMNNVKKIGGSKFESGFWYVSEDTAKQLIGADLFLHSSQDSESHFGGKIVGFRTVGDGDFKGRVVFEIESTMGHKGVKAGKGGWGNEKKIVCQVG